jgi:hypothetical protein
MRAIDFLSESIQGTNILKDPKLAKMLAIAIKHDKTFPKTEIADMGPRPTVADYIEAWTRLVNDTLANNKYGDLSKDGKFDNWILRLYMNHDMDYEDLNGEAGDTLGAWKALSTRGLLQPKDQDFNKFPTLRSLQEAMQKQEYRDTLRRIKDAEELEKHKRTRKEVVLIDNDRFYVIIPLNYGACYTFNNQTGHMSSFCTGGSGGLNWFNNYAPRGPIVSIVDKKNMNDKNGKWQLHAPTNQLVNSTQDQRYDRGSGDREFAKLFPGLMKEIVKAILTKANEIKIGSKEIDPPDGYDIREAAKDIVRHFPISYKSMPGDDVIDMPTANTVPDNTEFVNQPAEPQQPGEPAGPEKKYWVAVNSGRRMGRAQYMTRDEAQRYLQQFVLQNRIPKGRAYMVSSEGDDIIRLP